MFVRLAYRCTCLDWKSLPVDAPEVRQAAEHVVAMVNNMTSSQAELCARLELDDVTSAVRYVTNDNVLMFKQSSDHHGRVADLSDNMKASVVRKILSAVRCCGLLAVS